MYTHMIVYDLIKEKLLDSFFLKKNCFFLEGGGGGVWKEEEGREGGSMSCPNALEIFS